MQSENVKLKELKINENNPRQITEDKMSKLVESLLSFPKMLSLRPIVINDENVVLGGNMRTKGLQVISTMDAAQIRERLFGKRKFKKSEKVELEKTFDYWVRFLDNLDVEVVRASGLTDYELNEFLIKDNLAYGTTNFDLLTSWFDEEDLLDWDMDIPVFEEEDEKSEESDVKSITVECEDKSKLFELFGELEGRGFKVTMK